MKTALLLFLRSTYLRQIVTGFVGAFAAWLVSLGCPPEYQDQIVTAGAGVVVLICQIIAELQLKRGNKVVQDVLDVPKDGVILTNGQTVQAAKRKIPRGVIVSTPEQRARAGRGR